VSVERDHRAQAGTTVRCAECKGSSGLYWQGWRAYRIERPESGESPALAFYCPSCAPSGPERKAS